MMVMSSALDTKQAVRLSSSILENGPLITVCPITGGDRIAEYDMKLMDIDADTLGIPETNYDARITMSASEFTRIVRDLSSLGESVRIEVSKEGVRFASDGEAAQGNILLKQTEAARERYENYGKDDDDQVEEVKDEEEEDVKPKKLKKASKVKKEEGADDEDAEMASGNDDEAEFQAKSEDEGEEEASDSEKKKRKRPAASSSVRSSHLPSKPLVIITQDAKAKKKAKKVADDSAEGGSGGVLIEMAQHVNLTFSLKYLVNFSKSASLSDTVQLMLTNDVPLLVCIFYRITPF
jgi:proliferating cell nuclear antigen